MSKKNKVARVEIFRWKARSDYAILITRKHGVKVYQRVTKTRAMAIEQAAIGLLWSTSSWSTRSNHNTSDSICTKFHFDPPMCVYFVQVGMDGYMPNNVSAYPTLAQAIEAAKEEKHFTLNSGWDSVYKVRVTGNIRRDWEYVVSTGGHYDHSIRIVKDIPYQTSFDDPIVTRADLEKWCDEYNESSF